MTDKDLMPFGKHKGTAMANVPAYYLLWIFKEHYNNSCTDSSTELCKYIHENLDVLKSEVKRTNQFYKR
jgi:uncharacterized protein (DUF3820 family)